MTSWSLSVPRTSATRTFAVSRTVTVTESHRPCHGRKTETTKGSPFVGRVRSSGISCSCIPKSTTAHGPPGVRSESGLLPLIRSIPPSTMPCTSRSGTLRPVAESRVVHCTSNRTGRPFAQRTSAVPIMPSPRSRLDLTPAESTATVWINPPGSGFHVSKVSPGVSDRFAI